MRLVVLNRRAQGHRFLPRTVMARMTGKMLAPAQHATADSKQAATAPGTDCRASRCSKIS
jgi:hypothetical protein